MKTDQDESNGYTVGEVSKLVDGKRVVLANVTHIEIRLYTLPELDDEFLRSIGIRPPR